MEAGPEAALLLARLLEELDGGPGAASYQDLCKSLCARLDLPQLARLRSALFHTACLDPGFPAALFKDKTQCSAGSQQSKKLLVAADIVTMFNLLQMSGAAAREKPPAGRATVRAPDPEACDGACEPLGREPGARPFSRGCAARQPPRCRQVDGRDRPQFVPACEPGFLLGVGDGAKSRASSLDRLQPPGPYAAAGPPACEMQRTYFPMSAGAEAGSDQDSLPAQGLGDGFVSGEEPFAVPSCVRKRSIFKEDFHNLMAVSPGAAGPASQAEGERGEPPGRKEPRKPPFFNHSFEMPQHSQHLSPGYFLAPDRRRAKHESLDDLQASTYFGPSPVLGSQEPRRCAGRPSKQTAWPAKSWSLNTEEVPDFERSFFNRDPSEEKLRYPSPGGQSPSFPGPDRRPAYLADPQPLLPVGYAAKPNGLRATDISSPVDLEKHEPVKKFKDKSIGCAGGQLSSDTSSVGTQTEPRTCRDLCAPAQGKYGDRRALKHSDDDSEIVSDDISDIFRFLDDMSISGSTGVMQSSCYNSTGSLSQLHKSDCDSSPEHNVSTLSGGVPGGKGEKGSRHAEEELKTSVRRLVLRIGEIERKLESLSGVREDISQVLGRLSQLDQQMQQPDKGRAQADPSSSASEAESDDSASPQPCRAHGSRGPRLDGGDWGCSDASGSNSASLRVKALKKSLFARPSSRSLTEENSATESKIASTSNSPRDWRTVPYAGRAGLGEEVKGAGPADDKDWPRKPKEADRQYDLAPQHRLPKQPKDFLVEQVFSPHPCPASLPAHMKSNPLYTDMRLTELAEVKRGQPSWTVEEYARNAGDKGKLTALDLQTQESLNPNNLEYWMEDIYTPGYDSLLKRKEAEFRRAKVCKMAALIAAAACTVILVIVVPICTMKS
ncbi:major intrinsically disordered Notch2-binding receptor 1 [Lemur catta]|uniref:major intrinsically disordered Notch2-binding receptor 1 n=1 Tax=Lemur catta TaxID=9447 RepID=UPI001E266BC4|nr:major intrinsically disordered Notch2-binding receptor 1 [Lemur catta]